MPLFILKLLSQLAKLISLFLLLVLLFILFLFSIEEGIPLNANPAETQQ